MLMETIKHRRHHLVGLCHRGIVAAYHCDFYGGSALQYAVLAAGEPYLRGPLDANQEQPTLTVPPLWGWLLVVVK